MKTAIYIEDGVVQLVLTPEDDFEKSILGSLEGKSTVTEVMTGGFYNCRGGWTRHSEHDNRSLIIRTVRVEHPIGDSHPI